MTSPTIEPTRDPREIELSVVIPCLNEADTTLVPLRVPQFFIQLESEKSGFMGRRSVRPVEQILWVECSPEQCEDDSRYSARAKLRSCAWRRQGKGTS
jgi:hypothetical protein